jgi:hypothetical protein
VQPLDAAMIGLFLLFIVVSFLYVKGLDLL